MNILRFFVDNPIVLLAIVSPFLLLCGVLIGNILSQPRKNRVLQLSPESGRGVDFDVKEHDALNLRCDPVGNMPPQRFIRRHNAFNVVRKGWFKLQNYALWIVRFGTAYVSGLENKPEKATLDDAMRVIFTEDEYKQIPKHAMDLIRKGELGVTVNFTDEPLTPQGPDGKNLPSLSSDDLRRGDVDNFIGALARGVSKLSKTGTEDLPRIIFILMAGVGIGVILSLVFGWGAPTIIQ